MCMSVKKYWDKVGTLASVCSVKSAAQEHPYIETTDSSYRCVYEVQHVGVSVMVLVEQGSHLGLDCDAPPPLHWQSVQHLPVAHTTGYHTCRDGAARASLYCTHIEPLYSAPADIISL